jgi:hypothetical protein
MFEYLLPYNVLKPQTEKSLHIYKNYILKYNLKKCTKPNLSMETVLYLRDGSMSNEHVINV